MNGAAACVAAPPRPMWPGPYPHEATSAFQRAQDAGLSAVRSLVMGVIASHKDGWIFRKTIARKLGCSVRTVQRAITQAKSQGLLNTWRAKKNETPAAIIEKECKQCGARAGVKCEHKVLTCGWSHRLTVGWGLAQGKAILDAVAAARAKWTLRSAVKQAKRGRPVEELPRGARGTYIFRRGERPQRKWTAAELTAELERRDRESGERERKPPD